MLLEDTGGDNLEIFVNSVWVESLLSLKPRISLPPFFFFSLQLVILTPETGVPREQGWRVVVASLGCQSPGEQQDRGFRGNRCFSTLGSFSGFSGC